MGALRQLGSLFWKNYVIRKRHPAILLFEIIWPVLIFVLVGILRTGIPPEPLKTCSYPERALPGNDMVPFLQSSVCTLNNDCKEPEAISKDFTNQQRFQAMVADISPILSKNTTINAVKALPTVQKILQIARDITNGTDLDGLDDRLKLRNMFSDPDKVIMLLTDKYKVLSPAAATDLLDSTLNIVQLMQTVGTVDFKGIVCSPDTLKKYILFPKEVNVTQVSTSLCSIDESLVSNITNEVVRMIDIPNMIRMAEDFANVMGAFDYAVLLEDMANMVEMLQGRSAFASLFTDLTFLSSAPTALRDLAKMIPILTGMGDIDFESLEALYEIFKPMVLTISEDPQTVETINTFLEAGNTLLQAISDPNTDWSVVIQNFLPLLNETSMLIDVNLGSILSSIPDLSIYLDMFMNPNETVAADSVSSGVGQAGNDMMMRMMMGNETMDTMMIVGFGLMDMMEDMMDFFTDMDDSLRYSVETNTGMGGAMSTLYEVGPEKTGEFITEIISVENIRNIYTGTKDVKTVCTDTANSVFVYVMPDTLTDFKDNVCTDTVTEVVQASMTTEKINKLEAKMKGSMEEMEQMLQGNISLTGDMTMEKMNKRLTEMMTKLTTMAVNITANWDSTLMKVTPNYLMVYDTTWRQMWMNMGELYAKSNLLTQLETTFKVMENTTLWNSVDNIFLMVDALMSSLRKYMGIVGPFTGPDSTLYTFAAHIKYLPQVIEGFMKHSNVLANILQLETMDNLTAIVDVVCDVNWADLNISSDVPLNNIENLICLTNWTQFMDTMFISLHPFSFLKEIEDVYMYTLDNGINWPQMIDNLDFHLSLITNDEVMSYINLWTGIDIGVENMLQTFGRMQEYVMKMGAAETVTSNKGSIIEGLDNLDRQMGEMESWNQVKHYVYVVVMYHKVINRYLADARVSGFNATLYIKEISPTLGDFVLQSASTVPELLDGIQYAMSNVYNTMNTLLVADFMDLCNSIDINELLNLPDNDNVTKFKEELCALNWSKIGEELMESDDNVQQLLIELNKLNSNMTLEPINLNWTDIVSTVEEFITLMEGTVSDQQSFMWDALDLDAVNGSYTAIANNIWTLPEYDANWQLQALNSLAELLYQQNDPMMGDLMIGVASQTYINYHVTVFLNRQLKFFTSSPVVNLRAYMNSAELNKLFDALVKSPDLVKIMRVNVINILLNMNTTSLESVGQILDICNMTMDTLSSIEIPADVKMTSSELQTLMCRLDLNTTKLMEELINGLDGLDDLIDSLEYLSTANLTASDLYINVTTVQTASNMTSKLFEDLLMNPPDIAIGSTDLVQWIGDLLKEVETLIEELSSVNISADHLLGSLATSQQQFTALYMGLLSTDGETNDIVIIMDMYSIVLEHMLTNIEGFLKDPDAGFIDYPEMKKLWLLLEQGPHVMETFIYTSVVDNMKVTQFTMLLTEGLESLCAASPDELMTVPPESSFDFSEFFNMFCAINMTSFEEEYRRFIMNQNITDTYDSLGGNMTRDVNMTALTERIQALMLKVTSMAAETYQLPQFMNETAWSSALEYVGELLINNTSWEETLLAAQQQSTITALSVLNQLGDINGILKVSELYMILLEKMASEGKDLMTAPGLGLMDYPEMLTVWELMDHLPNIMETFIYTSYVDNLKLSKVIELVTEGIDKLCGANPDDLMTVPPGSSFNFTAFFHKFCSINMTKLEEEYANFTNREEIQYVWDNVMSYNETINVTKIMERYDSLMVHINNLMTGGSEDFDLPRFLDSTAWDQAFQTIMGFYENNMDWIQSLTTTSGLNMIDDPDMTRVGLTVDMGLDLMIERLKEISANLTVETLTRDAPNLVLMMKSMASLNSALKNTTLKENINEDKLMGLAMDPETMMKFCENESLAMYIRIDQSKAAVATDVQNILCVVMDTEDLLKGLQDQVDYEQMELKLMSIWNMSTTDLSYDWDLMNTKLSMVIELLTNMTISPPPVDPILTDMLDMESILKLFSELASSPAMYAALSNTLSPLTGNQAVDASGISSVVMYIIELFEQNDWSMPITALLPDSSTMAFYIQELLSVDSYQTMMLATLDPEQFWMLILSGDWEATVCDPLKFSATFTFPAGLDVGQLQTDLCERSKSKNLNSVFRSIDVAEITNQLGQYVASLTSQNSSVDSPMTLEKLANYTASILEKLVSTGTNQPFNIEEYLRPITDALSSLNPSYANIFAVCNQTTGYISGTGDYQTALNEYLHTVYLSLQVSRVYFSIQNDLGDVLCDPDAKNVSVLVMKMKEKEIPDKLQYLAEVYMGKYDKSMSEFTCEGVAKLYANFTDITTTSVDTFSGLFNESSKTLECVEGTWSRVQDLLEDMTRLIAQGSQIINILQEPKFRQFIYTILESNQTLEILDEIVNLYRDQQNSIDSLRDALQSNVTDLLTSFENNYNIAPDALRRFVNSTFDQDFTNKSSEEILDYICNSPLLEDAINLDPSFASLKTVLCGDDRDTALQTLNSLTQIGSTLDKIQGLPLDSQEFYEVLTKDLSELVSNIEGISEMAGIIGSLEDLDITNLQIDDELLDTLQRLLVDNGPDDLYTSLTAVISNFGDIDGNNSAEIVTELQAVTKGLFAFGSLRSMLIRDVKITDLVKDSEALTKYMRDELGLSAEIAQAITDGSISFKVLMDASSENITDWVCDSSQLAKLIELPEGVTTDPDYLSEQFCMLDSETVSKILEEVLQLVDVGDFMQGFIENSFYNLLSKQNVTMEDSKASLATVQIAQADLKKLLDRANEYSASIPNAVASLASAQTGSSASMNSLSAFVCGREVGIITDDFNIGSSVQSSSQLSNEQITEMNTLPGEYCKKMYEDIMVTEAGPIIWAYLKPLLRGKILYTPNTGDITSLMIKVNSTFSMMDDVVVQARDWAKGAGLFEEVSGEKGKSLQDILDSQLVGGVVTDFAGMSTEDIKGLLYSLNGSDTDLVSGLGSIMTLVAGYVDCIELDRFVGFETEEELNAEAVKLHSTNSLLAGLVFDIGTSDRKKRDTTSGLPKHINYRIRMDIDNVQHTYRLKERMWRPKPEGNFASDLRYLRGFIQLQQMIDGAIISTQLGTDVDLPAVSTQQFPFPCHTEDMFINVFAAYLLPILMTIAWLAGISVAVYNLVYDRENGQEETLKAMGLKGSLNWWAWFISTMLICSAIAFINAVILKYWDVFTHSSLLLVFLFFVDFVFSSVMLCYFVSAFFTRTTLAILSSLIVYIVSYLPYVVLISLELEMEFYQKVIACLSSTTAFSFGSHFIARYEEQQIGVQWNNIQESPLAHDNFSFHWACIMMVIDGCVYLVLGWYVRNVKPGKYGIAQPWYFPVSPYYWGCGGTSSPSGRNKQDIFSEEVTTDFPVVISMRGLSKKFSGRKVVDNLSLDIHAGHVTALLGHNGAAKSTTMNMLTGILEPTAGEVRMFNRPQNKMKESVGICPQHNALFEYMTVIEHMEFYTSMKSTHSGQSNKHVIKELLKDIDLWYCRYTRVKELSGGMQRRLCVALAFVGGSRAVILDEPTAGVDPSGRRAIWNLIIKRKTAKDNTEAAILLSTHHLDEADILGDRIAILHEGKLLCHGSPMFLKQHLTQGHRLTITKGTSTQEYDPTVVLSRLQQWVPMTKLQQMIGHEMTFVLPSTNSGHFYNLLKDLEMNKEELKIDSYGVSDPTLEEVFLKVCLTADVGQEITPSNVIHIDSNNKAESQIEWKHNIEDEGERRDQRHKDQRVTGTSLKLQQFGALLTKRFHHYRRNWRMLVSILILPLLMFLMASGFYYIKPKGVEAPSILLTPATYGPDTYVFYKFDQTAPLVSSLIDSFEQYPGIGTSCMAGFNPKGDQYKCVSAQSAFTSTAGNPVENRTCYCDDFELKCSGHMTPPRSMVTTTTDILLDLESKDIEKYLLDSFHEFIEKRYGGWSFTKDDKDTLHAKVWFNNKGHHALPSFLNAYSNGLLRALVNETHGSSAEFGISAHTHPYLFSKEQLNENTILQHAADAGIAVTILVAFTFFPVGVMMYVVMENLNKDKHLQTLSGVGPVMYWLASSLWDLLVLVIAVACSFGIIAIFRHDSFWDRENASATVALLFLYGWATIPLTYCCVKIFKTMAAAFFTMFCIFNFIGIATVTIIFVMSYFASNFSESDQFIENIETAKKVLLVFPQYAMAGGLLNLIANEIKTSIYAKFNADVYESPFTFDMIAWNLIVMGGEGVVFFIIAVLLEIRCNSCSSNNSKSRHQNDVYEDVDVQTERRRIQQADCKEDILVVRDLHKIYPGRDVHAVSGLTFGVPGGQCFGLLGVNGAGKTTTFKMLTGSLEASHGEAWLLGNSVKNAATFGRTVGYCPQEEALDLFLSVEEMLAFHCKLKGIPSDKHNHAIQSVMDKLSLHTFKDTIVKSCSGGMKRKLSLAIALLGDPPIVLLDEPTTGMDPKAKRLVWDCLLNAKKNGQAIVLTSHSLEECDILCDRIAIMVNGEFKCLGSSQHLKDKFGEGYTVTLNVVGLSTIQQRMQELVQKHFPGSTIRDQHQNIVQMDIPKHSTTVSEIFGVLEAEKHRYNIAYYTVSQTTLDTIFLNFARDQGDGSSTDIDTGSSSIESFSDEMDPSTSSIPTAFYAYQNKMYDTYGDSDYSLKRNLASNKYIMPSNEGGFSTKM